MEEVLQYRGYTVSRDGFGWYEVSYKEDGETKTETCTDFYEAMLFVRDMTQNDWFSRIFPICEGEAI